MTIAKNIPEEEKYHKKIESRESTDSSEMEFRGFEESLQQDNVRGEGRPQCQRTLLTKLNDYDVRGAFVSRKLSKWLYEK